MSWVGRVKPEPFSAAFCRSLLMLPYNRNTCRWNNANRKSQKNIWSNTNDDLAYMLGLALLLRSLHLPPQLQQSMGFLKIVFLITAPLAGLTIAAFRLGNQLPLASRLFGNYIGLGYVYFKSIITYIKPVDHLPFEMISLARKTSQQSQALKRELKSTLKRVREDINNKKEETFKRLEEETGMGQLREDFWVEDREKKEEEKGEGNVDGSLMVYSMLKNRDRLLLLKKEKKKSRRFFDQL